MNLRYIKEVTGITFIIIIFLQAFWILTMYKTHAEDYEAIVQSTLSKSVDTELSVRNLTKPHIQQFFSGKENMQDTIQKKLTTEDTVVYVYINRYDPRASFRIEQFFFKNDDPVNIEMLDSIFHQELLKTRFPVKETYIDYIDLITNKIIKTNRPAHLQKNLYETPIDTLDIINTIGIRAYTDSPVSITLNLMLFQLVLSVILIAFSLVWVFILMKTTIRQSKAEKIRKDFVNTMTHEFKRPIASALLSLSYALEKLQKTQFDDAKDYFNSVAFELKRLNLYTEKIQKISIGEEVGTDIQKETLNLLPFFETLKEKYEKVEDKQVHVDLHVPTTTTLNTDFLHFSNIMENLMENAIKYSDEMVNIRLNIIEQDKNIQISVRDDGWGIAASEKSHIFDKFYRGRSLKKRRKPGFGLGLSYVKMMTSTLDGTIIVHSEEGEYTEFILNFPV